MLKSKGLWFWFFIFTIHMLIACLVPTVVLLLTPAQDKAFNIEVAGISVNDLTQTEFVDVLQTHYNEIVNEGEVILKSDQKSITIPYKLFELQIDAEKIVKEIEQGFYINRYFQVIGKANEELYYLEPNIYINEAKLKDIINKKKSLLSIEGNDAQLVLEQGGLSILPHKDGLEINTDKTTDIIYQQLTDNLSNQITISKEIAPDAFDDIKPKMTTEGIKDFSKIYGYTEADIPLDAINEFDSLIKNFNNIVIHPGEEFSFNSKMETLEQTNYIHTLLASSIYKMLLPVQDIKVTWRKPTDQPLPDIEPGFEVELDNGGDLRFKNTSDTELIIVLNLDSTGKFNSCLAGMPGLTYGDIKTQQIKIPPPVIYSEDSSLPKSDQKVIDPGKEGLTVKVFRVVDGKSVQLYEDTYSPVNKIISVGTDLKTEDIIRK